MNVTIADLVARIGALPVTPGAGMILATRDEILTAITGIAPEAAHTRTHDPIMFCDYCSVFPVAEEATGYPALNFVGTRTEADAACAAYLTTYRGWVVTATDKRCGDCVRSGRTVEG